MPHFTPAPTEEQIAEQDRVTEAQDPSLNKGAEPLFQEGDIALFISPSRNFRKIRIPADDVPTNFGRRRIPGLDYQFENGMLRITEQTHLREEKFFAGLKERLNDREWALLDRRPGEEWLRDQDSHGTMYWEQKPLVTERDISPVLQAIFLAQQEGDAETIGRIFAAEQEGENDERVISALVSAANAINAQDALQAQKAEDDPEEPS